MLVNPKMIELIEDRRTNSKLLHVFVVLNLLDAPTLEGYDDLTEMHINFGLDVILGSVT